MNPSSQARCHSTSTYRLSTASTLDALVDFTQLQVKTEHREKTEHSAACWQFKQMESGVSISSTLGMMVYFSAYFVFHAWIAASQFKILKKADWKHSSNKHLSFLNWYSQCTSQITGLGYRLYTDACNYSIAASLHEIQSMAVKDLKGTRIYERLEKLAMLKNPFPI